MKRIALIVFSFLAMSCLAAQTNADIQKKKISKIQQSENEYLYADVTSATIDRALVKAKQILQQEISAYLGQKKNGVGDCDTISGLVSDKLVQITMSRGDKYRVFVYVQKDELAQSGANADESKPNSSVVDIMSSGSETDTDDMVVDSISIEMGMDTDVFAVDSVSIEQGIDTVVLAIDSVSIEPVSDYDDMAVDSILLESSSNTIDSETVHSTQEDASVVIPVKPDTVSKTENQDAIDNSAFGNIVSGEEQVSALRDIVRLKTKLQIYDYIMKLQKEGVSITYKPRVATNDNSYFLIAYRRNGSVAAILGPGDIYRMNLGLVADGVHEKVRVSDYKKCSFDGFKFEK